MSPRPRDGGGGSGSRSGRDAGLARAYRRRVVRVSRGARSRARGLDRRRFRARSRALGAGNSRDARRAREGRYVPAHRARPRAPIIGVEPKNDAGGSSTRAGRARAKSGDASRLGGFRVRGFRRARVEPGTARGASPRGSRDQRPRRASRFRAEKKARAASPTRRKQCRRRAGRRERASRRPSAHLDEPEERVDVVLARGRVLLLRLRRRRSRGPTSPRSSCASG